MPPSADFAPVFSSGSVKIHWIHKKLLFFKRLYIATTGTLWPRHRISKPDGSHRSSRQCVWSWRQTSAPFRQCTLVQGTPARRVGTRKNGPKWMSQQSDNDLSCAAIDGELSAVVSVAHASVIASRKVEVGWRLPEAATRCSSVWNWLAGAANKGEWWNWYTQGT